MTEPLALTVVDAGCTTVVPEKFKFTIAFCGKFAPRIVSVALPEPELPVSGKLGGVTSLINGTPFMPPGGVCASSGPHEDKTAHTTAQRTHLIMKASASRTTRCEFAEYTWRRFVPPRGSKRAEAERDNLGPSCIMTRSFCG